MKRIIRIFYTTFAAFLLLFVVKAQAQPLSGIPSLGLDDSTLVKTEISLLTCEPHEAVYSLYGHTAIRLQNVDDGMDVVANWGVFDSSKPNFVMNFVLGLTDYIMAIFPTEYFAREYTYYGTRVYQQRLNLTVKEKRKILQALEVNNLPENRTYRYNFYYDNCTTRARDVILGALDGKVAYLTTEKQKGEVSFRDLIHWKTEGFYWCRWGNDMLLGLGSDRNATHDQREFIPEVLQNDFDSAYVLRPDGSKEKLVDVAFEMLPSGPCMAKPMADVPFRPRTCALAFLIIIAFVTAYEKFVRRKEMKWFDRVVFHVFGLVGILLVVMLFSEHPTVKVNLQILFFCPLWLVLYSPFMKWKHRDKVALALLILFYLGGIFQTYAEGNLILASALLVRILSKHYINEKKQ